MPRLFAEAFLVPVAEPDSEPASYTYDEQRAINVLADGQPVVEAAVAIDETSTLTEVRAEHEDRAALAMETLTKIAREGTDRAAPELLLGTETRRAPGEREDFVRDLDGGTHTAVRAEAEDFPRDSVDTRRAQASAR
jgi:hypothetical protein